MTKNQRAAEAIEVFNPNTMRLSVREGIGKHHAVIWTRARICYGGPAMIAAATGPTREAARAAVLAKLANNDTALPTAAAQGGGR